MAKITSRSRRSIGSDKDQLNELEKYWINLHSSNNPQIGYNLTDGGDGGNIIGKLPNKLEIYKKRADSNRGKTRSDEFKKKLGDRRRGKKMTDEQKQKLREHNLGKTLSEETKNKISVSSKGKKFSDNHKINISKNTLGKPHPNARKKIQINDVIYDSLTEASNKLQLATSVIHSRLNSNNFKEYKYVKS